jgi:tetratricopeptide (TPR) repeat protein
MYELDQQIEESLRAYEEACRLAPKRALYHYNAGMAFGKVGNLQRAAEALETACALSPTLLDARLLLGRFRNFLGEPEAAVKQARHLQAASSPGLQAQGDCLMGEIARIKNQLAESKTWFLRAAKKDPQYIDPLLYLGAVCFQQGKFDEALNWAERALKLDPNSARALNRKGLALIFQGQLDKAEEVLLGAIAKHPDYFLLYNNLGRAYYDKKDFVAAIAAYRETVALAPDSAMGHMGFAMALEKGNQLEEATREYARTIEIDPTYKNAYTRLVALNRRLGQKQMANSLLQKAESYGL